MTSSAYTRTVGPRERWCNAIGPAPRVLLRFMKDSNSATNENRTSQYSFPMMEMITEAEAGLRRGTRPRNQTSRDKISICRLHRYMTMRSGLAGGGLMAKETLKSTMSPPIASPDALNKAKSAVETESAREGYSPLTHNDDIIQVAQNGGRKRKCMCLDRILGSRRSCCA